MTQVPVLSKWFPALSELISCQRSALAYHYSQHNWEVLRNSALLRSYHGQQGGNENCATLCVSLCALSGRKVDSSILTPFLACAQRVPWLQCTEWADLTICSHLTLQLTEDLSCITEWQT